MYAALSPLLTYHALYGSFHPLFKDDPVRLHSFRPFQEFDKAMETYEAGLRHDPDNAELQDGMRRCIEGINKVSGREGYDCRLLLPLPCQQRGLTIFPAAWPPAVAGSPPGPGMRPWEARRTAWITPAQPHSNISTPSLDRLPRSLP